jgi:hypothetical protein
MILLDENINGDQRQLLEAWDFKVKQIGVEVRTKGVSDENTISTLHKFRGILFISRDSDFWNQRYCHSNYCLVFLDVASSEAAFYSQVSAATGV